MKLFYRPSCYITIMRPWLEDPQGLLGDGVLLGIHMKFKHGLTILKDHTLANILHKYKYIYIHIYKLSHLLFVSSLEYVVHYHIPRAQNDAST